MEINQGDVFWFDDGEPRGSVPAYARPVVVISQVLTVDKVGFIDKIGALSKERVNEILEGIKLIIEPREIEEEIE